MRYLMADIHGEFKLFKEMLEKINFSDEDELYILGDVVDRGAQPIPLLQFIMNKPNIKMILGNHEDMMLSGLRFNKSRKVFSFTADANLWAYNGGFNTGDQFMDLSIDEQMRVYEYVRNLPKYLILDEKYILVHAGVPLIEDEDFTVEEMSQILNRASNRDDLLWDRDMVRSKYFEGFNGFHIFVGHTPTLKLHPSNEVFFGDGFTVIDCGACFYGGALACYCLDTDTVFYISRGESFE